MKRPNNILTPAQRQAEELAALRRRVRENSEVPDEPRQKKTKNYEFSRVERELILTK